MVLVIILLLAAFTGLIYGVVNKNKKLIIASITVLIIIATIGLVYSYLYAKNPY